MTYCTNWMVECNWVPDGTASFTYDDCAGTNCWGGTPYTACSSY